MLFITTVISNSVANFLYMFYISNFDVLMYSLTGNSERVEFYVSIFGALLFIGLFLWLLCCATSRLLPDEDLEDRQVKCRLIMMFVGGACTVGMQYCASFRSARLQILSMTLHVVGKASFTSSSNTHISLVFPAKLFGRLYSVMAVCEADVHADPVDISPGRRSQVELCRVQLGPDPVFAARDRSARVFAVPLEKEQKF